MKSASSLAVVALLACACGQAPSGGERADAGDDPVRCATCHTPEFETTNHPPHPGARPTTCGVCHTQTSWHGFRVDHPGYALTGAHARIAADTSLAGTEKQVKCFWCHRGDPSTWRATKETCISCHEPDRASVKHPDHSTFPDTCETCHTTEAWKPASRPAPTEEKPVPSAHPSAVPSAHPSAAPSAHPSAAPPPKPHPTTPKPSPAPDVTTHASQHR